MDVKRYNYWLEEDPWSGPYATMEADKDGEYVEYETFKHLEDKLELVELSIRSILENPEIKTEHIKKSLSEILKEIR